MAINDNPYLKALERYKHRTSSPSQKEKTLYNEIEELVSEHNYEIENDREQEVLDQIAKEINASSGKLKGEETRRLSGAGKSLLSSILTSSKYQNSRIGGFSKLSSVQLAARSDISVPTEKLENLISSKTSGLSNVVNSMKNLIDVDTGLIRDEDRFKKLGTTSSFLEREIARHQLSLRYQKEKGLDPISVLSSAENVRDKAISVLNKDQVSKMVDQGNAPSISEQSKQLEESIDKLTKAIGDLNKSTEEERNEKKEAVKVAQEDVALRTSMLQYSRSVGNSGGGGGFERASRVLGFAGSAVGMAGDVYGQLGIANPLAVMENQRRFMDMQNQQYSTVKAMTEGDQMSLLKVMGMYGSKKKFVEDFFGRGTTSVVIGGAADALSASADVVGGLGKMGMAAGVTAATGGAGAGLMAKLGTGATLDTARSTLGLIAGAAKRSSDISNNITAASVGLDAAQRYEDMFNALNAIPASQMQGYEDQYRRSYRVGTGAGTRSGVMRELTNYSSNSLMRQLANLNISPERMAALSELGVQTSGGIDLNLESLRSAGLSERAGITSAEQYMQMVGSMSDIGGKNQDMFNIMKQAVAIGMDDSKNIGRMVSATVSLSERSAARGISAGEGVYNAYSRVVSSLGENTNLTASQRSIAARSQLENVNDMLTKKGTDIFSLQEVSEMSSIIGGNDSYLVAQNLAGADLSVVERMRDLISQPKGSEGYKRAAQDMIRMGFAKGTGDKFSRDTWANDPSKVKEVMSRSYINLMRQVVGFKGVEQDQIDLMEDFIGGKISDKQLMKKLTPETRQVFNVGGWSHGIGSIEDFISLVGGKKTTTSNLPTSADRAVAAGKFGAAGRFMFAEQEAGFEKFVGAMGFESWDKGVTQKATDVVNKYKKKDSSVTKQQFDLANEYLNASIPERQKEFNLQAQQKATAIMDKGTQAVIGKQQDEQRIKEAGRLEAPTAIVDASKAFQGSVDIFGEIIKTDLKSVVDKFESAVDNMNKLNNRGQKPENNNLALKDKNFMSSRNKF